MFNRVDGLRRKTNSKIYKMKTKENLILALKKIIKIVLLGALFFVALGLIWWLLQKPSLNRDWTIDQQILPTISFDGNLVDVKNVRNFKYNSVDHYIPGYYDKVYDVDKIESVYYIIEPFSNVDGPAHTMLSFGFSDGSYVVISAEIRKEKGESFDPLEGIMNQYEIVYVVGDENDLVKLRANYRKDDVYMYPINTPKEKIQGLFLSAMQRADKLTKEPEFYNTIWNTCTTNILRHVNTLREEKISWSKEILLPSNSDKVAFNAGLIDTSLTPAEAREYYKINNLSLEFADDIFYSKKIRKERK